MRNPEGLFAAAACILVFVGGCSGSAQSDAAARYAAAARAAHAADFDRAIALFRGLGGYRDAATELAAVRRTAAGQTLNRARRKLAQGSPRAAVALAQTAIYRYGESSPAARDLLARANRAQAIHHRLQKQGKAPG